MFLVASSFSSYKVSFNIRKYVILLINFRFNDKNIYSKFLRICNGMILIHKILTIHRGFGYSMYCYLFYRTKCVYPTAKQFMKHIMHFLHKMLHENFRNYSLWQFREVKSNMHFSNYIYIYQALNAWLSSCTTFSSDDI